jgi:GNAT superfamily N-acetyltransferase
MKAVQLDIPSMTEAQWHDLFAARTTFVEESRPDTPAPSHQDQRRSLSTIPQLLVHVLFWLLYDDDGNCVGYCSIHYPKPGNPDYEANKDTVYVEPVVLAPYRHQGIGTQLLPLIVDTAKTAGASWVQWDTKFESGFRFSEKLGATEAGRQRTNRLAVERVDWEMMERWVDEGASRNPEVALIRFVDLPPSDLLDPYCDLHTAINLLQPRDEVEAMDFTLTPEEFAKQVERERERGIERVTLCTRQADGTLSGMTNMFYSEAQPAYAHVRLTGVRRENQGHGLGKWLKAAMMLDMREHYPDVAVVDTDNFNTNRPMLSINDRIGFKPYEQFVFYKMRVSDLAAQVEERGITSV